VGRDEQAARRRDVSGRLEKQVGKATAPLIAVLAVVVAVAAIEFYAIQKFGRPSAGPSAPATIAASTAPTAANPIGFVDAPASESIRGPAVVVSGWALAASGIRAVEGRIDGRAFAATLGLPRPDVAALHAGMPDSATAGFRLELDLAAVPAQAGVDRRPLALVAIARDGSEAPIGSRSVIEPAAFERWRAYAAVDATPFHLLPALSGLALGAAAGLDTHYADYASPTTRIGTRIPVLYLRTTRGAAHDYAFDPDWNVEHRCPKGPAERRLSDDSLNGAFRHAVDKRLPMLFTLNGGIWGDAACDAPRWDVNDVLEQDAANCQWSEMDEVVGDDHLKNLAGAFESPELARALTLNVYARDVRRYKQRNLQQAARHIVRFAREHPELFVGVNLDPDLYLNPFFAGKAWFDYNPGTLRQFRHWLAGTGPYAGRPEPGVPDLSAYRRAKPLTLADASGLAGRRFANWDAVDPPRVLDHEAKPPYWELPWVREWETFRRHLVDLHYDELSRWLVEAGIPRERIWSSQGFMAPLPWAMPFALTVASPVKNYDSGGMSIEGAKPAQGHLGAILYGASAQNAIRMEGAHSLFGAFAAIDPHWAVVEFNSADLSHPKNLPTYADAYRGLRDMWNYGARFVSPMAWSGSDGRNAGKPGYDPFTAWRNTPLEEAAKDFLLARAHLSPGSKLWTFGAPGHADADGWTSERGTLAAWPGRAVITPDASGAIVLVSPAELMLDHARAWRLVVLTDGAAPRTLRVEGRAAKDAPWVALASAAGREARLSPGRAGAIDALRIELEFGAPVAAALVRVAILPDRKAAQR
jgi:hypothetical protein